MRYAGMPMGMWLLFSGSFQRELSSSLGFSKEDAIAITRSAKRKYRGIIRTIPEFERGDRFKMNIVNCAMLSAFILEMKASPDVEKMTRFYTASMMIPVMRMFCRKAGRNKFSSGDIAAMKKTASFKAADRNPYSWNMEFLPYEDSSGYECRFTKCGICKLMNELRVDRYIPAMCRFDYDMSEAGGVSRFVRQYTLASGGPYCDCGYKRNL